MHSVDYAVARCLSVRPSVRPSVSLSVRHTTIFCRNGYTRRKILFTSCRHTIPVFRTRRYSNITTGPPPAPLTGTSNARVYEEIAIFDQYLTILQTRYKCTIMIVTMGMQIPKLSNGAIFNNFEWPLFQMSRSQYYSTSNNSKIV